MFDSDFAELRRDMVEQQLRRRGISDWRVLEAMGSVPREKFVPESSQQRAYDDGALPIGYGQTISQPYVVAFMAELAQLQPDDKVLEIGAGSGYAAAVLGTICREVYSIERIVALGEQAHQRLAQLGYRNVYVSVADGTVGLSAHAPYDAILVPAAAQEVPRPLVDQLVDGGRLVIPIGGREGQRMMRYTRRGDSLQADDFGAFAFVPLIGQHAAAE